MRRTCQLQADFDLRSQLTSVAFTADPNRQGEIRGGPYAGDAFYNSIDTAAIWNRRNTAPQADEHVAVRRARDRHTGVAAVDNANGNARTNLENVIAALKGLSATLIIRVGHFVTVVWLAKSITFQRGMQADSEFVAGMLRYSHMPGNIGQLAIEIVHGYTRNQPVRIAAFDPFVVLVTRPTRLQAANTLALSRSLELCDLVPWALKMKSAQPDTVRCQAVEALMKFTRTKPTGTGVEAPNSGISMAVDRLVNMINTWHPDPLTGFIPTDVLASPDFERAYAAVFEAIAMFLKPDDTARFQAESAMHGPVKACLDITGHQVLSGLHDALKLPAAKRPAPEQAKRGPAAQPTAEVDGPPPPFSNSVRGGAWERRPTGSNWRGGSRGGRGGHGGRGRIREEDHDHGDNFRHRDDGYARDEDFRGQDDGGYYDNRRGGRGGKPRGAHGRGPDDGRQQGYARDGYSSGPPYDGRGRRSSDPRW